MSDTMKVLPEAKGRTRTLACGSLQPSAQRIFTPLFSLLLLAPCIHTVFRVQSNTQICTATSF